ncbi:MAG: hypothetical protein HeimC2_37740 [Candidatus Heimdallarchaeota archaeon LC_2]|nr:MAG: hypothetical protein HeimC2_37740 [Candidatus Heimdallarchaeota archaeon LC_2]
MKGLKLVKIDGVALKIVQREFSERILNDSDNTTWRGTVLDIIIDWDKLSKIKQPVN